MLLTCTDTEAKDVQLRECQHQLDGMLEMLKHLRDHAPLLFGPLAQKEMSDQHDGLSGPS